MRKLITDLYNKYIITFISIAVLSLYTFFFFYILDNKDYSFNIHLYFVDLVLGTFIAYKILEVYKDKLLHFDDNKNGIIKILVFFVSGLVIFILHAINFNLINNSEKDTGYEILKVSYLLIPQFLIFYLEVIEKNISVPKYALMVFKNSLSHFVFTIIVSTGIFILYLIYEALIGNVDYKTHFSIVATLLTFTTMTGYLISMDNTEYKENVFLKVLVYYVMQSIVFVGFVIVYAFVFNIIIKMKLPPNQIYMVGITVFFIGVITSFMSQAFDEKYKISKLMPILFIPILIMQYIAILVRIFNYGLSVYRYIALMVLVFETTFLIFYIFKYENIKNIFLYAIGIVLILFYIPFINIYSLPNTLNNTLLKDVSNKNVDDEQSYLIKKSCDIYKSFSETNINISGFDKLDRFSISYEFDASDNKFYNRNSSYKKPIENGISDLKNAKAHIKSYNGNMVKEYVILDIDEYMKSLEKLIIYNDYDKDLVENNIENVLEINDKKIILTYIELDYRESINNFKYIYLEGYLLTKN